MIVGILAGFFSFAYLGVYGSLFGGLMAWVNPQATLAGLTGEEIKAVSIGLPLLAIAGGAICGGNPFLGGVLLLGSAFGHYAFLGYTSVSQIFILSIGLAGALAILAEVFEESSSTLQVQVNLPSTTQSAFDRAKWNALLQYDEEIRAAAEKIKSLGPKWLDELAQSYLALNDKTYLPSLVEKIANRADAEVNERLQLQAWAKQREPAHYDLEQPLGGYLNERMMLLRDHLLGSGTQRLWTIGTALGAVIIIVAAAMWPT